jgi:hypothetical protein
MSLAITNSEIYGRFLKMRFIFCFACLFLFPNSGTAQIKVPNGSLAVTYRQVEDGEVGKAYHEIQLSCWDGECELQTVTLNQCWSSIDNKDGYSFIKVEKQSTREGNLKIVSLTKGSMALEARFADATLTYRFSYQLTDQGLLGIFSLKDFSGGMVKNSDILNRVVAIELVPIRTTDSSRFESVKLDCPIRVQALPVE